MLGRIFDVGITRHSIANSLMGGGGGSQLSSHWSKLCPIKVFTLK